MSDGSLGRIRTEPLQNIGAQDILSVGYNYYGFLRKKRRFDTLKGSSRWKQRFVVLSEGCLYCFNHESSAKPMAAVALCFYERAHELFLKIPHCFEIKHEEPGRTPLIFSCESDERRKQWLDHVNHCIEQSGQLSASSLNLSDQSVDEGIVADKAPGRPRMELPEIPKDPPPLPPSLSSSGGGGPIPKAKRYKETARSEYDLESEEEDDYDGTTEIYDDVVEEDQTQSVPSPAARKAMTLPGAKSVFPDQPTSSRPKTISGRPSMPLPLPRDPSTFSNPPKPLPGLPKPKHDVPLPIPSVPPPKPSHGGVRPTTRLQLPMSPRGQDSSSDDGGEELADYVNIFQSTDYMFDSNDRDQAKSNLTGQPDGTFLIRKSRSSASRVLSVVVNGEVKEFQVTNSEDGQQVSIDKQTFFPSLDAMLNYYNQHDLPKSDYSVKLKRGFNKE